MITRNDTIVIKKRLVLPEEVILAVHLILFGKAFLVQGRGAVRALEALGVPGSVEDLEDEAVEDGLGAPGTFGYGT